MKAGLVTIIGRSNVGKSTLLNSLVGSKVAITTPKPQTTRLPISGILTQPAGQAVLVDTPGIMQKAKDPLTQKLLSYAKESLHGVDAVIYVVDPTRAIGDEEKQALKMISVVEKPKLLVINMTDLKESREFIDFYRDLAENFDNYVEVSALTGKNLDLISRWVFDNLPEGEPLYPEFQFTNLTNETWLAELIREKLFLRLRQEVPYSTHVEVNSIEPRNDKLIYVNATIYTNADRYRPMIIGHHGQGIKEIGQSVRKELESVTSKKYYLELEVKTDPHWLSKFE
jgi:GTP-binding protein Era